MRVKLVGICFLSLSVLIGVSLSGVCFVGQVDITEDTVVQQLGMPRYPFSLWGTYFPMDYNSSLINDDLDQHQDHDNGYEKIYGGLAYAQSFTPQRGNLQKIEVKIGCYYSAPWFIDIIGRIANVFLFLQPLVDILIEKIINSPGDLVISLYDSYNHLPSTPLYTHEIGFDDVPKDKSWYPIDIGNLLVTPNTEYFIVLQAQGGDSETCYTWSKGSGNPYGNGKAFISTDDKATWEEKPSFDFCFRVYGEYTGEEPDGVINYWGVICGVDGDLLTVGDDSAVKMYTVLSSHGWDTGHLRLLKNGEGTEMSVIESIRWMDSMDDGDDVSLFYFCGHGAGHGIGMHPHPSGFLSARILDSAMDELGSQGIVMIFDSCYSGGLQTYLGQANRVLLLSSLADEESCGDIVLASGIFTYYLTMGLGSPAADVNHDGWVSAEEAFSYAEVKTTKRAPYPQHPEFVDGYPGDLLLTQV